MYFWFVLGKFFSLIFPRSFCYRAAKILAYLQYHVSQKDREAVKYNLEPILSDKKNIDACAKEVFVNFSYYLVDFFRYPKLNKKFIEKYVTVSGLDKIDKLLAVKKGIILLAAHSGNYELGGAVTALLGYPISAVALPHENKRLSDFFNRRREMTGIKVISTGVGVKKCFSALRNGDMLALLGDKDFAVKMFSRYALLPRGPAFFALKTGCPIVPSFFLREKVNFYHLIFDDPIECAGRDEMGIVEEYAKVIEKYIRQYPDQWYMFQPYWLKE